MKGQKKLEALEKIFYFANFGFKNDHFHSVYTVSRWQFFEIRSKWTTFSGHKMFIMCPNERSKEIRGMEKIFHYLQLILASKMIIFTVYTLYLDGNFLK